MFQCPEIEPAGPPPENTSIDITCKDCGKVFQVYYLVLDSHLITNCVSCFVNSNPKLNHEEILFKPDHVIDNIFIGGFKAAERLDLLKESNITRVVVCGEELDTPYADEGILYHKLEIGEDDDDCIEKFFDSAHEFISSSPENTLIHCTAGVSRSATIVMSHLMRRYKMPYKISRALLKSKRKVIRPIPTLVKQLENYEVYLRELYNKVV